MIYGNTIKSILKKDLIVVCPPTNLVDEKSILSAMNKSYRHFKKKEYNVVHSLEEGDGAYLNVKKTISPDVVFFTNPYGYTLRKYQIKNFLDVLTCYVQYSFIMEAKEHFYNKTFHSLLWKAFYETKYHKKLAEKYAKNRGINVDITGYPGTDNFLYGQRLNNGAWKNKDTTLKRIIWAPHWSVINRGKDRPSASNFIQLSKFMLDVAEEYKDEIQIAFMPHPYLKRTLYNMKGWGKEKTESYYSKWDKIANGQLETGNYIDLFNSSDAMILDSMSFIAEYLYCGKPSLFMNAAPDVDKSFNEFGQMAFKHHYQGSKKGDITNFIENVVIYGNDNMKEERDRFYREILTPPNGKTASQNIYEILCKELFN